MGSHGPLKLVFGGASMQVILQPIACPDPYPCSSAACLGAMPPSCCHLIPEIGSVPWCQHGACKLALHDWLTQPWAGMHSIWLRTHGLPWHQLQPET